MKYFAFIALLFLAGCKTSGQLRGSGSSSSQNALDPTGIKTLDAPPGLDGVEEAFSGESPEALRRQLVVTQGELENLRYTLDQERETSRRRIALLEEENRKLTAALSAIPQKTSTHMSSGDAPKDTVELLWKQVVEGVKSRSYSEALVAAKSIVDTYPKSKRLWGATLVAGMLEYQMKNYKEAAIHFNNAIDMTAKRTNGVSLPWYFQGLTFMRLNKKEDAALFLGELQRKYPTSQMARKAKGLKAAPDDLFADVPNWLDFTAP
jgi:TolA-binding protein